MAIGSGLAGQLGIKTEVTPGTPVAVDQFTRFDPGETLQRRPNFAQHVGLAAGALVPPSSGRYEVSHDAGGDVTFDVPMRGMGRWVQPMFGSTATPVQILSTTAYRQIHNLGSSDGKTFTLQKGVPRRDGTVEPFTFAGCKITQWALTAAANGLVKIKMTVDAVDVSTSAAGGVSTLQAASYSLAPSLFTFLNMTVSLATAYTTVSGLWTPTSPTAIGIIRGLTLNGGQPKDVAAWQAGSATKAEQLVNDYQTPTGSVDVDFASRSLFDQFAGNTSTVLQINLTGPDAGGGNPYLLQFTLPAAFLESGSTPQIASNGVVTVSYPFAGLADASGNALQAQIVSTDTSI
ncbi:MAG TPA: phage tail tube protein [Pseudonocardiaceae bacterium]|nr:phage tail tube protein [Pseudonocardiaceae bacterium]